MSTPNTETTPADRFAGYLRFQVGRAADRNLTDELYALDQQAMGAFYATGDGQFRAIANYATECAARILSADKAAPTRH